MYLYLRIYLHTDSKYGSGYRFKRIGLRIRSKAKREAQDVLCGARCG